MTLPASLPENQVQAWLQSLGGIRHSAVLGLELRATDHGLAHHLVIPHDQADYVVSQLRSLVPGVRVVPVAVQPAPAWTVAIELGLTDLLRTLRIPSPEQLSTSLLASVQGLRSGEMVLLQWVVTPARPETPPPAGTNDRSGTWRSPTHGGATDGDSMDKRAKLSEPNFLAVLRIAVHAGGESRAGHLLNHVRSGLTSANAVAIRFRRKPLVTKARVAMRIEQASGSLLYGAQLSVSELTGLIAWPIGSPHVAGLPQGRTRQLPATAAIPKAGRVIGRSNFPGAERPLAVSYPDATKHLHVIGPTGTGKTTLLTNMVAQDMQQGYGVIVLESKGDLFTAALDRVPRRRIKDVIVLDVNDTAFPVGFNVLNSGSSHAAVDELSALITGIYGDHGGVYTPMIMYYGLHALAETTDSTFIDLPTLLTPQGSEEIAWRDQLVQRLHNRDVRQFWERYLDDKNRERDRMAAPVHNRVWQLAVRPEIRNIIGQSRSSFTFDDVLTSGKILLINLNGVRVGEQTASLVGTLLMNSLYTAVRTVRMTKPAFLYLDEFQDFVNLPVNAADMLAKTRSFGLGLVLAHQDLDQLSKVRGLEQAVLANARSKLVFQTSARDARVMQREFGRLVDEDDFINLGAHEALARIATTDGVSAPITLVANPPTKPVGFGNAVRAASRSAYGRPLAQVEAEIEARRRLLHDPVRPKPNLGAQKWEK
ncbi:type IV secretory system conjugative DNA transfer family protein [Amycolatopsis sp. H20-H5]|uniref:type IV secretory system conjugative DNA transfer family protein n=1 Tax=Amycolatopsis sp. H20-H5 TaxID=3046309 RepID=UPI002DBC1E8A|nr:type IV secretory system conjugative DNA transfer family protein [Amycolatopsis sp. H20-H5]MEC3978145.1 type IV secretory system conjugative DNA transfer family protein [Amycolatopsis sp. H20-H5]